jgi:hypothetical protein
VVWCWQLPTPEGDVWRFPFPFTLNQKAAHSLCGFLYSTLRRVAIEAGSIV